MDFFQKGKYETNINPQVYSFHVIFNRETMRLSFTVFCIYALGLQYMPEKAPTNADFSLLSSLPPPTSEIATDKNTTLLGKVSTETHDPLRKKPGCLLEQPLHFLTLTHTCTCSN